MLPAEREGIFDTTSINWDILSLSLCKLLLLALEMQILNHILLKNMKNFKWKRKQIEFAP